MNKTHKLSVVSAIEPGPGTVIITGGNSGLGLACARSLLETAKPSFATIILACRDPRRAAAAVMQLQDAARRAGSFSEILALPLDLGSLASVRAFAAEIKQRLEEGRLSPLHSLVCNAGVQAGEEKTFTRDGFETTFGVNHLGHYLLTTELLPFMHAPARIVVVASGVHDPAQKNGMMPAPAWSEPTSLARGQLGLAGEKDSAATAGRRRYSTSKLANVYFTYELARRLPPGSTANAFDPGLMPGTGLAREASAPLQWVWHKVFTRALPLLRLYSKNVHTPQESGRNLARLVIDPTLSETTGSYFEGPRRIPSSQESYDTDRQAELWRISAQLTAAGLPLHSERSSNACAC